MQFKIGDLVKGICGSPYGITNEHMTCGEIVDISPCGNLTVKLIKHDDEYEIGREYSDVSPDWFRFIDAIWKPKNCKLNYQDIADRNRRK